MKRLTIPVMAFSLLALGFPQAGHTQVSSSDRAQTLEIARNGSQPSTEGSAEYFTGSVRINPLFPVHDPSRASEVSPSSLVRAQRGIPILWGKLSS